MTPDSDFRPHLVILCVEDEPAVLDALIRDLAIFEDRFLIEAACSAAEARNVLESHCGPDRRLALVLCDHLMPGETGTDFLIALNREPSTRNAKKVLVTAQAGLADTIRAVNQAGLDHYVAKPWTGDELCSVVRSQLTEYVIENEKNLLPFLSVLDAPKIAEALRKNPPDDR